MENIFSDIDWDKVLNEVLSSKEFVKVSEYVISEIKQLAADLVTNSVKTGCDAVRDKCNCKRMHILLYDDTNNHPALPNNKGYNDQDIIDEK